MNRLLFLVGVCCLCASDPVVRAQARDLRVLDAVKRRDTKAFAALLKAKADVNAAQPDGATALAWAVHLGERRMAEALLASGARANTTDEYGETPVTLAAANGDAGLVERLVAAGGSARAARRSTPRPGTASRRSSSRSSKTTCRRSGRCSRRAPIRTSPSSPAPPRPSS